MFSQNRRVFSPKRPRLSNICNLGLENLFGKMYGVFTNQEIRLNERCAPRLLPAGCFCIRRSGIGAA